MQRTGAGAAAAELLDAAIDEVKQHRQSLEELLQFLRDARKGLLTEAEVVQEALMWRQLVEAGWQAVPGGPAVERAVAELAPTTAPAATGEVVAGAAAAAHAGAAAVAATGEVVAGAAADAGAAAVAATGEVVAGAAADAHAGAGADPVTPSTRAVARPVAPEWPPAELPHPGSVVLEPPGPEDDERALLLTAATATVDGCSEVVWARLKGRGDVLVVAADEPEHQAAVVQELSEALPASVFPDAVVVGRRADLVHPLVEQVVATGRRVSAL